MVGKVLESDPVDELILSVEEHKRATGHSEPALSGVRASGTGQAVEDGSSSPDDGSFSFRRLRLRHLDENPEMGNTSEVGAVDRQLIIQEQKFRLKHAEPGTEGPSQLSSSDIFWLAQQKFSAWAGAPPEQRKEQSKPPPLVVGFDAPSPSETGVTTPRTPHEGRSSPWNKQKASSPLSHMLAQAGGAKSPSPKPVKVHQETPPRSPVSATPPHRVSLTIGKDAAHAPYPPVPWDEVYRSERRVSTGSGLAHHDSDVGVSSRLDHRFSTPPVRNYPHLSSSPLGPRRFSLPGPSHHGITPPSLPTDKRDHGLEHEARSAPSGSSWHHRSGSAPVPSRQLSRSWRRSLVGSFQECLLSGRLPVAATAHQHLEGFLAVLTVAGGDWSPPQRRLPFSVVCVDANTALYSASIELSGTQRRNSEALALSPPKPASTDQTRSRYRVPHKGKLQLVVSNPEGTPVHTFVCNYDLSDMAPGQKTYVRQKILGVDKKGTSERATSSGTLLYAIHAQFMCTASRGRKSYPLSRGGEKEGSEVEHDGSGKRCYLYGDLRVVFPQRRSDADNVQLCVEYEQPNDPKYFDL